MTVDRKRLRELALGALDEPRDVYDPRRSQFLNAANPQTILELLDALEAPTDDARNIEQMLSRDGLYIVGDTNRAGVLPIAVINGEAYAWEREGNPLRRDGWHDTAVVLRYAAIDAAIAERTKEQR